MIYCKMKMSIWNYTIVTISSFIQLIVYANSLYMSLKVQVESYKG